MQFYIDLSVIYIFVCFLIIFMVARKFLFLPLEKILEERRGKIDSDRSRAESHEVETARMLADYEAKIAEARSAGFATRQRLRDSGAEEMRGIVEHARGEAATLTAGARAELEAAVVESKRRLAAESGELASQIATAILGRRP